MRFSVAAPDKIHPTEFEQQLQKFCEVSAEQDGEYGKCKDCGSRILCVNCYISHHSEEFEGTCAGNGEVTQMLIPYCPHCDPVPATSGCVHYKMFGGVRK